MKCSEIFFSLRLLLPAFLLAFISSGCGSPGSSLALDPADPPAAGADSDAAIRETLEAGQQIVRVRPQEPQDFALGKAPSVAEAFADPLSQLALLPPPPKGASCAESDLSREASDSAPELMANRTAPAETDMLFSPAWDYSGAGSINDVAYCTYRFSLQGISSSTEAQSVRLEWNPGSFPTEPMDVWVAFANWQSGRWDWFSGPDDPVLTIPSFAPYEDADGQILMVVALLGQVELRLDRLRVGALEIRGTGEAEEPFTDISNDAFIPPLDDSGPLPAAYDISYGCGDVGNQGEVGSCTAWAAGHSVFAYELRALYEPCGWLIEEDRHRPSPRYLYVKTGDDCPSAGRDLWNVLGYLKDSGCATQDKVGYGFPWLWGWFFNCDSSFDQDVENEAALFTISERTRIFDIGNNKDDINEIKKMIAIYRKPLAMRVNLDDDFSDPDYEDGETWTYNGDTSGGHAMAVVGYDDAKQAFYVRNSWGDGWGDDGHCWISYATFNDPDANVDCHSINLSVSQALVDGYADHQPAVMPPANFRASKGTDLNQVVLTWESSGVTDLYDIYRGEELLASVAPSTSYSDTTAEPGVAYMYKIRSRATQFESSFASSVGYRASDPYISGAGPLSGRAESLITFSAETLSSEALSYEWDFGGAAEPNSSTEASPSVVLKGEGIFKASVSVSNSKGTAQYEFDLVVDPVQEEWAHSWGLSGDEEMRAVAVDSSGASYSAGALHGSPDRALVVKHDAGGNLIWARSFGDGSGDNRASAVTVDGSGNVIVGFDGGANVVAAKLNSSGECIWTARVQNAQNFNIRGIAVNSLGEVFCTGTIAINSTDVSLLKIDVNGNLQWSKTWGGSGYDSGSDVAINEVDQLFVCGTVHVDAGQEADIFLLQLNPADGSPLLQRAWGGQGKEQSPKLDTDSFGNVYISGSGENLGVSEDEIVLIRHDIDSELGSWSLAYGIPASIDEETTGIGICTDTLGAVHVLGLLNGKESGQRYHVLLKLSHEGALLREERYVDPTYSVLRDMAFSEARKLYVVGDRQKRHTPFWDPDLAGEGELHNPNLTRTDLSFALQDYAVSGWGETAKFDVESGGVVDNGGGADDLYIVKFNPEVEN